MFVFASVQFSNFSLDVCLWFFAVSMGIVVCSLCTICHDTRFFSTLWVSHHSPAMSKTTKINLCHSNGFPAAAAGSYIPLAFLLTHDLASFFFVVEKINIVVYLFLFERSDKFISITNPIHSTPRFLRNV